MVILHFLSLKSLRSELEKKVHPELDYKLIASLTEDQKWSEGFFSDTSMEAATDFF